MAAEADGAAADVAVEEARGVAVEIISINEEGTQFKLNEANLKAVMRRAVRRDEAARGRGGGRGGA